MNRSGKSQCPSSRSVDDELRELAINNARLISSLKDESRMTELLEMGANVNMIIEYHPLGNSNVVTIKTTLLNILLRLRWFSMAAIVLGYGADVTIPEIKTTTSSPAPGFTFGPMTTKSIAMVSRDDQWIRGLLIRCGAS